MCQLLAMNCNTPTDINFSFDSFRRRGGITDGHKDGFGIAFFEGKGVRTFLDSASSAGSPVAKMIDDYHIRSKNVVAHIRKATQGRTGLANTHPFMREIWGEYWIFAHNGNVKNLPEVEEDALYQPVGDTDSEKIFCMILNRLREKFKKRPDDEVLLPHIKKIADEIGEMGLFNFVLSNGSWLACRSGSLLHYIVRKAPFGIAHAIDNDRVIDFSKVTTSKDVVSVVATIPITDNEVWTQMAMGEFLVFQDGVIIHDWVPEDPVYPTIEEGLKIAEMAH